MINNDSIYKLLDSGVSESEAIPHLEAIAEASKFIALGHSELIGREKIKSHLKSLNELAEAYHAPIIWDGSDDLIEDLRARMKDNLSRDQYGKRLRNG